MWTYIWLAVLVISAIIEFITLDLVSIWVSVGSIFGVILALCGVSPWIQIIVALVVAILCLIFLRKITLKILKKDKVETNINAAINEKLKLITAITDDENGSAKYNGVIWTVASVDGKPISANEYVTVVEVSGNKLICKKENN